MAFVNQETVIDAVWLNKVEDFIEVTFNGATTASEARTAIGADVAANINYDNGTSGLAATDVQDAIDEAVALVNVPPADEVTYDNATSGLTATDVQAAIDEIVPTIVSAADEISYDNATSGLTATDVQGALDEVDGNIVTAAIDITYDNSTSGLSATDVKNAIDEVNSNIVTAAGSITYNNATSGLAATDVQGAIDEVENRVDILEVETHVNSFNGRTGTVGPASGDYSATQVTNAPSGNLTGTTVQAALNELQGDIDSNDTDISNLQTDSHTHSNKSLLDTITDGGAGGTLYLSDDGNYSTPPTSSAPITSVFGRIGNVVAVSGDYTASEVTNVPSGNLTSTDAQGALNELQGDIDTNGSDITALQADAHTHSNKALLDTITDAGPGTNYLSDDGTYNAISGGDPNVSWDTGNDRFTAGTGQTLGSTDNIVIGRNAFVTTASAIGIGVGSQSYGTSSVAVGASSISGGSTSVAIGPSCSATGTRAISVGYTVSASSTDTIVIGSQSNSTQAYSISLGPSVTGTGSESIAIGRSASATSSQSIAIGLNADNNAQEAIAIGEDVTVDGRYGLAIGHTSTVNNDSSIAIGRDSFTSVDTEFGIAIGYDSQSGFTGVTADNAIAIGTSSEAWYADSITIGTSARVGDPGAIAIGLDSYSRGVSIGSGASTRREGTTAIGPNCQLGSSTDTIWGISNTDPSAITNTTDDFNLAMNVGLDESVSPARPYLQLPSATGDPVGISEGAIYWNSGSNVVRVYDGSTWADI